MPASRARSFSITAAQDSMADSSDLKRESNCFLSSEFMWQYMPIAARAMAAPWADFDFVGPPQESFIPATILDRSASQALFNAEFGLFALIQRPCRRDKSCRSQAPASSLAAPRLAS